MTNRHRFKPLIIGIKAEFVGNFLLSCQKLDSTACYSVDEILNNNPLYESKKNFEEFFPLKTFVSRHVKNAVRCLNLSTSVLSTVDNWKVTTPRL